LDERAKVFVEYLPIEKAWKPVVGEHCLLINCLWVSGRFKGQGLAKRLLDECIFDARAQGKQGVAVVSSTVVKPFLTEAAFYRKHGFQLVDQAAPWFELLFLPLEPQVEAPRFSERARLGLGGNSCGITFVWSSQCPFMAEYVASMAQQAREQDHLVECIELESARQAQELGSPFGTMGMYFQGKFVNHELMPPAKFAKLLATLPV
jgi:predicted GNAT family acetyltransferase